MQKWHLLKTTGKRKMSAILLSVPGRPNKIYQTQNTNSYLSYVHTYTPWYNVVILYQTQKDHNHNIYIKNTIIYYCCTHHVLHVCAAHTRQLVEIFNKNKKTILHSFLFFRKNKFLKKYVHLYNTKRGKQFVGFYRWFFISMFIFLIFF